MWPWGHLVVGYVLYSLLARILSIRIDGYAVFLVALGTQFPDLIDKPLGWTLSLLPSGRSLGHSLLFALPVIAFVALYYHRRRRLTIAFGFAVGYVSHLLTDAIYYVPSGEFDYYAYLLWPFVSQPSYPTGASFAAHILQFDPGPYFLLQLFLVGCTAGLWIWDETPGISTGSPNIRGEPANTSEPAQNTSGDTVSMGKERLTESELISSSAREDDSLVETDADDPPTLSVVIPTLNEQESIKSVIEQVKSIVDLMGITAEIIVADNSTDKTAEIASENGAVVVIPDSVGYGYACRTALAHARGELVVFGAGNSAYDFRELPGLITPLVEGNADVVNGSRFKGDIRSGASSPIGYAGNMLLSGWLKLFYGVFIKDVGSSFRALDRETLDTLDLKADGVEFANETLVEAAGRDCRIIEVPVTYHRRKGRRRLDSFQKFWQHFHFAALNTSGCLFLIPGLLAMTAGAVIMPLSVLNANVFGALFDIHFLIASSSMLIVGYQFLALGIFARVTGNPVRMPSDSMTTWVVRSLRLRHVAMTGVFLLGMGSTYVLYALNYWLVGDESKLTVLVGDIVALTALTVGIEMVLTSFYISYLHR